MKILAIQMNPIVGDLEGNVTKILNGIKRAKEEKADVVVFPEMAICGYPPEDLVLQNAFISRMEQHLQTIAQHTNGLMAIVGLVRRNDREGEKQLNNSAAVIIDGKVIGYQDKWLLPTYDVFDERRYFEPGKTMQIWEYQGKRVGIIICEDFWQHAGYIESYTRYEKDPILEIAPLKPDFLINLSASPYYAKKPELRFNVCKKTTQTLQVPLILCCQVGANGSLIFDGFSLFLNGKSELCHQAKGFEEDEMLIDLDHPPAPMEFKLDVMHEMFNALVLGVRDYFKKFGFKQACLGLSGGIDSALVAVIAVEALGKENLLAISMPSDFTTSQSEEDARVLAQNLGIEFQEIPIKKPYNTFLELLQPHFQEKPFDVTEENLQARIRGIILMAMSNKFGRIVLSTGNKSETALGYSTLYGDMCGGLGVIGDVVKTTVYDMCHWINREKEVIPRSILTKAPSAELRPDQKDSDSLPDYAIVDTVLRAYVEDYLSPEQIVEKYHLEPQVVTDLIRRIHLAEYKRRQGPPVLRVSKKAFGVGRRYPIVQRWH